MPLLAGTRLGPYEIVAPLGAGGMGEVYRARDSKLGREVAIKAMPQSIAAGPELLARFEREAQILASLNHPNIGAIYGREDQAGVPHLVLELVPGETLAERLKRGPLVPREAMAVAVQIAAAIEAAHEQGIVHRDLKPGNVMITPGGAVKVLDFGLAKGNLGLVASSSSISPTAAARPDATVAGTIVGTVAYMSPEQARGQAVDRRSDIWAFACVLYECFTARAAFEGATASDVIARILEREPDWTALPAGVPPRARELLRRCLRKNADERPRDIRDVRLELAAMASGAEKGGAEREKSVAVLPFENLSGADDDYFADGMTEEILGALVHVEGLRVAARTSCFAFKGKREDLRVVGEKLDVATVLEGSVRRSGNRLRISVQLVNVADGYQLWSERYDREMTDVFEIQDEIATAIARRLSVALQGGADRARGRRGTSNLEAYELMLKGRALQLKRGRHLLEAMPIFEKAIALDPNYAEAIALLADCHRLQGTFGIRPPAEVMPRGKALAEQALAIQPDLPEANAVLATIQAQYERDWAGAAVSWERALAADPRHVRSRCERAMWALGLGKMTPEQGQSETARAIADDPLNPWALGMHAFLLGFGGRHEEAIQIAEQALAIDPESFFGLWQVLRALAWGGEHERAREFGAGALAMTGRNAWILSTLCWSRSQAGDAEFASALCDEMLARARQEFVAPSWLAVALEAAGRHEEAMATIGRAFGEHDPMVMLAPGSPWYDGMRADPRWAELAKGIWE